MDFYSILPLYCLYFPSIISLQSEKTILFRKKTILFREKTVFSSLKTTFSRLKTTLSNNSTADLFGMLQVVEVM